VKGNEVCDILKHIGATRLHHANSVTTSCTFLEQGALLSRGFVEDRGFRQTAQPSSDEIDKRYGIWHDVFLDHVDIHDRGGRKKGPNKYGPVLFVFDLDILLTLPSGSEVRVTKSNPIHWYDKQPDVNRWFQTPEELAKVIGFGDFDKMLVIRTPSGRLDFPERHARIILDDPQRQMSSGENAYDHATNRLTTAGAVGKVEISIERRVCQGGCVCVQKYAGYSPPGIDTFFG